LSFLDGWALDQVNVVVALVAGIVWLQIARRDPLEAGALKCSPECVVSG